MSDLRMPGAGVAVSQAADRDHWLWTGGTVAGVLPRRGLCRAPSQLPYKPALLTQHRVSPARDMDYGPSLRRGSGVARLLLPGEAATLRRRRLVALVTAAFTGDMTLTAPVVLAYSDTAVESGSNQLTLALIGDRLYSDVPARAVPFLVANVQFRRVRIARHAGDVKNGSTCSDDASPTSRRSTTPSRTRSSWPGHNK